MNAGSLFSGVGGMDLGLQRAGFDHAFFAEVDPWRRDVLRAHWPGIHIYEDVHDVALLRPGADAEAGRGRGELEREDGRERPAPSGGHEGPSRGRLDLLAGGFPCQDLSVAGRRQGLAGARSGLFFEFARIIGEQRPTWILLENVPGLLSSARGRDFLVVLQTLADLGYGVAWRVLDARYFGVPQRRRRVFIVGHLGGDDGPALRALCEGCGGHPTPSREARSTTAAGAPVGFGDRGTNVGRSLNAGSRYDFETETLVLANALDRQGGGPDDNAAQANHLVPVAFHQTQDPISEHDRTPAIGRTSIGMGVAEEGARVRRLTPVECERLMGWPDGWTAPEGLKAPDSRRYAACGDGVVANVAEWIGRRIIAEDER